MKLRHAPLLALLLLPSGPALALGWTPAFVQWYRDWKNPPPAPRAEEKYCAPVKDLKGDPSMVQQMESSCPRAGVYAQAYLAAYDKIKGDTAETSCTQYARRLQLLQDELAVQTSTCDTKAKSAAAAKGSTLAHSANLGQNADVGDAASMQEAQIPVREACIKELGALQTAAQNLSKAAKKQAEASWEAVTAAQKAQNGFASGGLPCKQKRSAFENRVRAIYSTLNKISSEATAVDKSSGDGIQKHQSEISTVRSYSGTVEDVKKRLK